MKIDITKYSKKLVFILPAFIFFAIFILYPTAQALHYSFTEWSGLGEAEWVGLANYIRAFNDGILLQSFLNNAIYILGTLLVEVLFGLVMALIFNKDLKFFGSLRTLFFAPMIISLVAVGILWGLVYDYNFGLINSFLKAIGLGQFARAWLGEKQTALASVIVVSGWRYAGLYMMIFYAALKRIPKQLYEAADIDGANAFQKLFKITLPLLLDSINMAILLCVTGGFRAFALFFTMTNGRPGHSTEIVTTWIIKQAFDFDQFGYGSALTVILIVVVTIFAIIQIYYSNRRDTLEY